jgi:hypothetical protein
MNNKYKLVILSNDGNIEREKDFKTLKEISDDLNVEIHLIRKVNKLTENRAINIKPHNTYKDLYDRVRIYNIKKEFNI